MEGEARWAGCGVCISGPALGVWSEAAFREDVSMQNLSSMKQGKNYHQLENIDDLGETRKERKLTGWVLGRTDGSRTHNVCKVGSIITLVQTRKLNVQGVCQGPVAMDCHVAELGLEPRLGAKVCIFSFSPNYSDHSYAHTITDIPRNTWVCRNKNNSDKGFFKVINRCIVRALQR